eukprot:3620763-Pleurochrysis_carterae.AAC.3
MMRSQVEFEFCDASAHGRVVGSARAAARAKVNSQRLARTSAAGRLPLHRMPRQQRWRGLSCACADPKCVMPRQGASEAGGKGGRKAGREGEGGRRQAEREAEREEEREGGRERGNGGKEGEREREMAEGERTCAFANGRASPRLGRQRSAPPAWPHT